MKQVVLDSNIIIAYLRSAKGLLPKLLQLQAKGEVEIFISIVTVFELFAGKSSKKDEQYILELVSNLKIIPFDFGLAKFVGEVKREKAISITLADFIIGITSLYLKAYLATRNKEHFKDLTGIKFFD